MKDIGRTVFNGVNFPPIFPLTIKSRLSSNEDGQLLCNTEMKQQHLGLQVQPVAEPYFHASLPAFLPSMYLSADAFEQYFLYPTLLSQCTRQILCVSFVANKSEFFF